MRIISGSARGTNLFTLDGLTTRPTLDRVKESLFNIIQNEIPESVFLDLFSGSGAVGLESASRGAKKTILCDKSKDAIKIINKNIEKTHLKEKVELYNVDYKEHRPTLRFRFCCRCSKIINRKQISWWKNVNYYRNRPRKTNTKTIRKWKIKNTNNR